MFCWLGSTYRWDRMVFVFHHLAQRAAPLHPGPSYFSSEQVQGHRLFLPVAWTRSYSKGSPWIAQVANSCPGMCSQPLECGCSLHPTCPTDCPQHRCQPGWPFSSLVGTTVQLRAVPITVQVITTVLCQDHNNILWAPETPIQKSLCPTMFTAAQFTIAKCWKQPKCPSVNERIKKLWSIYTWNTIRKKERRSSYRLQQRGWNWGALY